MCLFGYFLCLKIIEIPRLACENAATGRQSTPEDDMAIGGIINTLKQAFYVKHGIEPGDRFHEQPRASYDSSEGRRQ